ncbi:MAG: hypothetical protein EYC70_14260 [Planctomycetota bacterium]|nr:MAG: hypothetical protein EYC70_14260 [Planctomycetota bacterium]
MTHPTQTRFIAFLPLLAVGGLAAGAAAQDFNGDKHPDLVVGVPHEEIGGVAKAGAVNVYYADPYGKISTAGAQVWDQSVPGLGDTPEFGDEFGAALAWGDINGDGYDDLAIGVPSEDVYSHYIPPGDRVDAGQVHVLLGSERGLTADGALLYTEEDYWFTELQPGDSFGFSVAIGDVYNHGYGPAEDLVVGAPFKSVNGLPAAGAVFTFRSPFDPAGPASQMFTRKNSEPPAAAFDRYGWSLAIAEWSPWYPWLAIGIPFADVNGQADAGAVQVLYYSLYYDALSTAKQQLWTQDYYMIEDQAEAGDMFGYSLATGVYVYDWGWFNGQDLMVGVPGEDVNGQVDAGAVAMIAYTEYFDQLEWYSNQFISQAMPGMPDPAEAGDEFGTSLAQVKLGYGFTDRLAIGIPGEGFDRAPGAGAVLYIGAGKEGMDPANSQLLAQGVAGMADFAESHDRFGTTLYGTRRVDGFFAIGVPQEDVNGVTDAGAVHVCYVGYVPGSGNELWHQDVPGAPDSCEPYEDYGYGRAGN